ncbi:MAG: endopeptidase La [Muribaculaceae bacterium]|nr:endopeptidase La [Muribaculaceae bacterium]
MTIDHPSENDGQIAGMISINLGPGAHDPTALKHFDPDNTLILATRNLVLFPRNALPIQLGREMSVAVAKYAKKTGAPIAVVCQRDPDIDKPEFDDLFGYGTLARVIDVIDINENIKTAIVEGLVKVRLVAKSNRCPVPQALAAKVEECVETPGRMSKKQLDIILTKIRELFNTIVNETPDGNALRLHMPKIDASSSPEEFLNTLATHMPFYVDIKQQLLEINTIDLRAKKMLEEMMYMVEQAKMMSDIVEKTKMRMEQNHRSAFLQQQMDVIKSELGEDDDSDDLVSLEMKAAASNMPPEIQERFAKELHKAQRYNPQSPDYAVQLNYLETLVSLPWTPGKPHVTTLAKSEKVLNEDHYGLKKIKQRVLEQVALCLHNPEGHAPIICFVGPPGVGKTSLGKSIAKALGREFQRISLGGLHDEAEIRGHRRTYIGAMPGRIIDAMRRGKTSNPIIMLDELDKIGADYKGDPAAALLEVLDPAQNHKFHDNYIDVDYDLSGVMFLATANTLSTVSKPLLDRIEVIELSGYTVEEKIEIAKQHLIPRLREKHKIKGNIFRITDAGIKKVIEEYTAESGVRQLEKQLESLMRKQLYRNLMQAPDFTATLNADRVVSLLGLPTNRHDKYKDISTPGIVTGLAWTSIGGEILTVEAAMAPGKGLLSITGNLGDVMKESANLAVEWVKVNAVDLGIDPEVFKNNDIHLHFPEGAVPKDGPSAGITIATAITSALTGRVIKPRVAMTGEITLHGKVLPVGGIKEKLLAAARSGIKEILLSDENRRDVQDIEPEYLKDVDIVYVSNIHDVLDYALPTSK